MAAHIFMCCTNLDLVYTKSVHPGYEARQSSLSCSTHTDQQQMALRLPEDSGGGNEILKFTPKQLFQT